MTSLSTTWRAFTAAPHRVMFLVGALQGLATMIWWLADLLGRYTRLYPPFDWAIPSPWAHAYLMIYGFFPFFIFGFLMTTYPNWMNGRKVPARHYLPAFLLLGGGSLLFYAGLWAGQPLLITAVALMLAGWSVALYALIYVLVTARHPDKRHPIITTVALAMGWLGMASYLAWLAGGGDFWLSFSRRSGIWFFLVPILFTVCHRMLPFFSSRVLENYRIVRPNWALPVMLACAAGHGTLEIAGATRFLWLADLPFLALAGYFSYSWKLLRSLEVRLLAVLHIAFLWLSVALLLYAAQSLMLFFGNADSPVLGLAPLHALTVGFFASMVLGMVSRVTLGHSGRELVADAATWALFLGFQAAAIARVAADLRPAGPITHLYLLAAVVWLACFIPWAVKYAPAYWRPRADGMPG